MTIWVWDNLTGLTRNYHSEGAALVNADGWERAVELLRAAAPHSFNATDDDLAIPTATFGAGIHTGPEQVMIFPNAGCC